MLGCIRNAQTYARHAILPASLHRCRGAHIFSSGTRGIKDLAAFRAQFFSRPARIFFRVVTPSIEGAFC